MRAYRRWELLFSRFPDRPRLAASANWKVKKVGWQLIEIGEDFGRGDDVGIFGVHVAQADGVAGFASVKTALFCQDHPIVEAERIDHGCSNAA